MKGDLSFPEWQSPDSEYRLEGHGMSIVTDPEYDIPGAIIIGMARYSDYHNIVLDLDTVDAFADALKAEAARRRVRS